MVLAESAIIVMHYEMRWLFQDIYQEQWWNRLLTFPSKQSVCRCLDMTFDL